MFSVTLFLMVIKVQVWFCPLGVLVASKVDSQWPVKKPSDVANNIVSQNTEHGTFGNGVLLLDALLKL